MVLLTAKDVHEMDTVQELYKNGIISWEEFLDLRNRVSTQEAGAVVLETGVAPLDDLLGGGLRSGSVVSLTSGHLAMPEVFLYKMLGMGETVYFSFDRMADQVKREVVGRGIDLDGVVFKDIYSQYYRDEQGKVKFDEEYRDREIFELVKTILERIEEQGCPVNIVFDSVTFFQELEVPRNDILTLLNYVYDVTKKVGGVAVLVNYTRYSEGFVAAVENKCDVVIKLDVSIERKVEGGVERNVYVPKVRDGGPSDQVLMYGFGEDGELLVNDESVGSVDVREERVEAESGFRLVSGDSDGSGRGMSWFEDVVEGEDEREIIRLV